MSINIGTVADVKKIFFDREVVIRATKDADRKALGRIGSYVRSVAQNSIKKAPEAKREKKTGKYNKNYVAVSPPGSPPFSHTGRLKRGILFGYDAANISVVIGPTLLPNSGKNPPDAPEMLEYGGNTRRKGKPAKYRARPFMGPAMEKSEPFDRFWKDSITA